MNIFGRRKQHKPLAELQLPGNKYACVSWEEKGKPWIMVFDCALHEIVGHPDLPFRFGIAISFNDQSNASGMPTKEEDEELNVLTDALNFILTGPPRIGCLAFRMTGCGFREWVSYIPNQQIGESLAEHFQSKLPQHVLTHYVERDPSWKVYKHLAPRRR
jgi:hypothetical protein